MTKIKIDYSKACIYKIVCRDPEIKECYVGSTTNLTKRRSYHKSVCKSENNKECNAYKYQFIRENGGFDNWQVLEIEKVDCKSKEELMRKERYYIETLKASLNKNRPIVTIEEHNEQIKETIKKYYEKHIEQRRETSKKYYEKHIEQRKEYNKEYYNKNKEQINEKVKQSKKEYYKKNKEQIKKQRKEYYNKNKEYYKEYGKKYRLKNKE